MVEIIFCGDLAFADSSKDECCFTLELELGRVWQLDYENVLQLGKKVYRLEIGSKAGCVGVLVNEQDILGYGFRTL